MSLDNIISKEGTNASNRPILRTKGGLVKTLALGLCLSAATLFSPAKSYAEIPKPDPLLQIGGCTLGGFVLGTINYFLFAKPQRYVNESSEDYTRRCNKAYWTCTGIHAVLAAIGGTTWYLVNKDAYDKEQASKKKIDDPDNMNPIGPDPFSANYRSSANVKPSAFKIDGINLKIDADKTVHIGISGKF